MDILPLEAKESSYYHSDPDASETEYFNEGVRLSRVMSLPPRFGREVKEVPDVLVTSLEDDGARKGVDSPDMKGGTGTSDSLSEPIIMKGDLQKLGKIFKTWHQRYFEVQGAHMFYYKNSQKKDCFGAIDLSICFKCESIKAATFGHAFRLETTERAHTFSARTSEELNQWLTAIQNTMGGPDALKQKRAKPKRWESLKNTFSVHPRSTEPSPEHSLPAAGKKTKKNKKAPMKIKIRGGGGTKGHSRSPSPGIEAEIPLHKRPMSFHGGEQFPTNTLEVALDNVAPSRSLPSTPLTKKRAQTGPPAVPPSPDDLSSQDRESDTTGGDISRTATPISIEVHEYKEEEKEQVKKPTKPVPPPRKRKSSTELAAKTAAAEPQVQSSVPLKPVRPVPPPPPEVIIEPVTPEFLRRHLTWEEVREVLEAAPESEVADYDDLPAEEPTWLEQLTAIEQLRTFLAVCP